MGLIGIGDLVQENSKMKNDWKTIYRASLCGAAFGGVGMVVSFILVNTIVSDTVARLVAFVFIGAGVGAEAAKLMWLGKPENTVFRRMIVGAASGVFGWLMYVLLLLPVGSKAVAQFFAIVIAAGVFGAIAQRLDRDKSESACKIVVND